MLDKFHFGAEYLDAIIALENDTNHTDNEKIISKLDMTIKFYEKVANLHSRGYSHGDLIMRNVLWDDRNKETHLIDFGNTKQITNNLRRSDIYGCGQILNDMFPGDDDEVVPTPKDIYIKIAAIVKDLDSLQPYAKGNYTDFEVARIFSDAISRLQSIKAEVSLDLYKEKEKLLQFDIKPEDLLNDLSKNYIYSKLNHDYIDRINQKSLIFLLNHIIQDNRADLFSLVSNRYDLLNSKNIEYHQLTIKKMLDNIANGGNHDCFNAYCQMVLQSNNKEVIQKTLEYISNQAKAYQPLEGDSKLIKNGNLLDGKNEPQKNANTRKERNDNIKNLLDENKLFNQMTIHLSKQDSSDRTKHDKLATRNSTNILKSKLMEAGNKNDVLNVPDNENLKKASLVRASTKTQLQPQHLQKTSEQPESKTENTKPMSFK